MRRSEIANEALKSQIFKVLARLRISALLPVEMRDEGHCHFIPKALKSQNFFLQSDAPCLHSNSPYNALAQEVSADLIYSPTLMHGRRMPRPIIKKGSSFGGDDLAESVKSGKTAKSNITWENNIVEYTRDTEFTETCFDENVVLPGRPDNIQIVKRSPSVTMGNDRFVRAEDIAIDDESAENTPASSPLHGLRIPLIAETDASPSEEGEGQDSPMIEVEQLRNILKAVEESNSEREQATHDAVDGPSHGGEGAMGKDMPLPVNRALRNLSDRSVGVEGDSDGDLTPMTPAIFRLVLPISVALLFWGPGTASLSQGSEFGVYLLRFLFQLNM